MALGISAAVFILPLRQDNGPIFAPPYPQWLTSPVNVVSVSQLAEAYSAHGLTLRLPAKLVSGFSLTSVHVRDVKSPYGYAMITYSNKGTTDFRYAEVVFEVIPAPQPSQSELNAAVTNTHGSFQLLTVAGMPVLLNPRYRMGNPDLDTQFGPVAYALIYNGGIYYQARVYQPLTAGDLLGLIASFQQAK